MKKAMKPAPSPAERMDDAEFERHLTDSHVNDGIKEFCPIVAEARRARAEVAAKTEECALHESAARKNLATIVAAEARAAKLEKALREIEIIAAGPATTPSNVTVEVIAYGAVKDLDAIKAVAAAALEEKP